MNLLRTILLFLLSGLFLPVSPLFSQVSDSRPKPRYASPDYLNSLLDEAKAKGLYRERYWHLLLHYRKNNFGNYVSEADNKEFFHAPDGKINPEHELNETLKSFFLAASPDGNDNLHPQCRFPARLEWLERRLKIDPRRLPQKNCVVLKRVQAIVPAKSVSIIFASYYMNAPASMYGHTLMKFNSDKLDLLNFSVSYAANPEGLDPFRYVVYGLLGGYTGRFDFFPYHIKVREYNDMENRDMWEYRLNLTPEEIHRLVLHSFELVATATFNYFYLDENCAYHLLSLIEVGRPTLHLTDQFPLWVIPVETLKVLFRQNGLVSEIKYRPSLHTTIVRRLEGFSKSEKEIFLRAFDAQSLKDPEFQALPETEKTKLLDTLLSSIRFMKEKKPQEASYARFFQEALTLRSALPVRQQEEEIVPVDYPPHVAHDLFFVQAGGGSSRFSPYAQFYFSPQHHGIMSPNNGFAENSNSIFFDTVIRYYSKTNEVRLHRFSFLKVMSLLERGFLAKHGSYLFDIGARSEMILQKRSSEQERWIALYQYLQNPNDLWSLYRMNDVFFGEKIDPVEKLRNLYTMQTLLPKFQNLQNFLNPQNFESSWMFYNFYRDHLSLREEDFRRVHTGNVDVEYGLTFRSKFWLLSPFTFSVLTGVDVQPSKYFENSVRAGPALTSILLFRLGNWKWLLKGSGYGYTASGNPNDYSAEAEIRYTVTQNFQIGVAAESTNFDRSAQFAMMGSF